MRSIWKFELGPRGKILDMPMAAKILKVGQQQSRIFVWAEVDKDAPEEIYQFFVFPTGVELPEDLGELRYQDTVFLDNGLVFHVYLR